MNNGDSRATALHRWRALLHLLLAVLLLLVPVGTPAGTALAGPVNWQELASTAEGRQWWDSGSLRLNRQGNITVLSRFQPATPVAAEAAESASASPTASAGASPTGSAADGRAAASQLYVMEIDCGQHLFRDTSINGIPQWGSPWQPSGADGLIEETIAAVCAAAPQLLAGS